MKVLLIELWVQLIHLKNYLVIKFEVSVYGASSQTC